MSYPWHGRINSEIMFMCSIFTWKLTIINVMIASLGKCYCCELIIYFYQCLMQYCCLMMKYCFLVYSKFCLCVFVNERCTVVSHAKRLVNTFWLFLIISNSSSQPFHCGHKEVFLQWLSNSKTDRVADIYIVTPTLAELLWSNTYTVIESL